MAPSVSFPLPPRITKKLPIRNSWELISGKLPIPLPIFFFELIREVLANTGYISYSKKTNSCKNAGLHHSNEFPQKPKKNCNCNRIIRGFQEGAAPMDTLQ